MQETRTETESGKWWVSILCYVLYTLHRDRNRLPLFSIVSVPVRVPCSDQDRLFLLCQSRSLHQSWCNVNSLSRSLSLHCFQTWGRVVTFQSRWNSVVSKFFPVSQQNSPCFPCLGKVRTKFLVFHMLWPPLASQSLKYIFTSKPTSGHLSLCCANLHWEFQFSTLFKPTQGYPVYVVGKITSNFSTYLRAFLHPLAMRGFFVELSSGVGVGGGVGDRSRYELQQEENIS